MNNKIKLTGLLLAAAVIVAACGGLAQTPDAMMKKEPTPAQNMAKETPASDKMMEDKTKSDEMMKETPVSDKIMEDKAKPDEMMKETMAGPAWFDASLTHVTTGQAFKVSDFKGKVVLVETLAIWCSNCLRQQKQALALHEMLGERDDFVSLGLDIDPNEDAAALSAYTQKNGFKWVYTVAPAEVAREIGQLYGDQFLNPPSTPMFIIDREGEVHPLPFGVKTADALKEALAPYLAEKM